MNFLQPGIESLSTPILALMRKGVTALQNVRLLKWCAEYGIHVFWNVIYGFPGEQPEESARLAEVLPSLTHLAAPELCRLAIHRFSPYHNRPGEFGLEVLGPLPWYRLVYPADDATLADLAYNFDYRRGPGFVVVHDRRPNLEPADYSFDEREARLLLACEDGATAAEALAALPETEAADLDLAEVQEFLDGLVASRLMYEEGGRYLALPLPERRLTPS